MGLVLELKMIPCRVVGDVENSESIAMRGGGNILDNSKVYA